MNLVTIFYQETVATLPIIDPNIEICLTEVIIHVKVCIFSASDADVFGRFNDRSSRRKQEDFYEEWLVMMKR